jgi:hypothetical protein
LALIAEVTRLELLQRIADKAGTTFETKLTAVACARAWVTRSSDSLHLDREFECAQQILLQIGGHGLTTLVHEMLRSDNKSCCLHGIELSVHCADNETRNLLKTITCRSDTWNDHFPLLQLKAGVALAALSENSAVVNVITRWGIVLDELVHVRNALPSMTDSDLAVAYDAIATGREAEKAKGVFAITLSGRRDLTPRVREVTQSVEPTSQLAQAVTVALGEFGDTSTETIRFLISQLEIPEHLLAAHLALLKIGTPEAVEALVRLVERNGIPTGWADMSQVALNVSQFDDQKQPVAEKIWQQIKENGLPFVCVELLTLLGNLNLPEIREFLLHEAYEPEGSFSIARRREAAIRGLAKLDPDAAFEAVQNGLHHWTRERESLPGLLADLDEERAIPILCRAAIVEKSTLAEWAIGRALRWARAQECVRGSVAQMLSSENRREKLVGAQITGWLSGEYFDRDLKTLALNCTDRNVAESALSAISRRQAHAEVEQLLSTAAVMDGLPQWRLISAALKLGDPWLLAAANDPVSFVPLVRALSAWNRLKVRDALEKRKKSLVKEAEDVDRRRSNN